MPRFPEGVPTPVGMRCFVCGESIEEGDTGVETTSVGQTGPPNELIVWAHTTCWEEWVAGAREAVGPNPPQRPESSTG